MKFNCISLALGDNHRLIFFETSDTQSKAKNGFENKTAANDKQEKEVPNAMKNLGKLDVEMQAAAASSRAAQEYMTKLAGAGGGGGLHGEFFGKMRDAVSKGNVDLLGAKSPGDRLKILADVKETYITLKKQDTDRMKENLEGWGRHETHHHDRGR